jgi:hypothetical protein
VLKAGKPELWRSDTPGKTQKCDAEQENTERVHMASSRGRSLRATGHGCNDGDQETAAQALRQRKRSPFYNRIQCPQTRLVINSAFTLGWQGEPRCRGESPASRSETVADIPAD